MVTLLLIMAAGLAIAVSNVTINGDHDNGFIESSWMSLLRTLDPGTMGQDEGWSRRIVALLVTIGGILIVSTLIGLVTSGIDGRLAELRKGRSE